MSKKTIALITFFSVAAVGGPFLISPPMQTNTAIATATPEAIVEMTEAPRAPAQTVYNTNSWFSSAYSFPSQPLYSYPGAFKISDKGLGVANPVVRVDGKTIFGSYDEMCSVNAGNPVISSKVVDYGDWNVNLALKDTSSEFTVGLVQGMPQTYISNLSEMNVSCQAAVVSLNESIAVVKRGESAIIFQGKGDSVITSINDTSFKITSPEKLYRVSVLPSLSDATLTFFKETEWNSVTNTAISYVPTEKTITTTYSFVSEKELPVLTTVWPHHGKPENVKPNDAYTYSTVIGPMKLVETKEFSTKTEDPSLVFQFEEVKAKVSRDKIIAAIKKDSVRYLAEKSPEGVYFKGTWIGALTSLVQLADLYNVTEFESKLVDRLQSEMQQSLTQFAYDDKTKMYIAKKPEFGNEKGNDHHFHYGYYIRAAAVLEQMKKGSIASESAVINEMVADVSNEDYSSSRYPRYRSYSVYEGHSWADGVAGFADGNNQESTSESLNAWYALWMWGNATGDTKLQERGEWLFSQEVAGTQSYWFGKGNPFPTGYAYPISSLVWGGKRDFSTWFSAHPMHILGIQFLPMTPASKYLAGVSDGVKIEAFLRSEEVVGHEWGDLYLAYLSYFNPDEASQLLPRVQSDGGLKLESLRYQVIYSNQQK